MGEQQKTRQSDHQKRCPWGNQLLMSQSQCTRGPYVPIGTNALSLHLLCLRGSFQSFLLTPGGTLAAARHGPDWWPALEGPSTDWGTLGDSCVRQPLCRHYQQMVIPTFQWQKLHSPSTTVQVPLLLQANSHVRGCAWPCSPLTSSSGSSHGRSCIQSPFQVGTGILPRLLSLLLVTERRGGARP